MSTRDEYVRKMHAWLDELNGEIDEFESRIESAEYELRDDYRRQVSQLRARQHDARQRLAALREAGEDAWQDLRAGADMAGDAIREALASARSRFGE